MGGFATVEAKTNPPLWRLDASRNEPTRDSFGSSVTNDETRVFYLQAGEVKAVDTYTGKQLWAFRVGNGAQLKYGSGTLLALTVQGKVYALEPATGQVRWSRIGDASSIPRGVYTISDKTLYIAGAEKLSAIDLETGTTRWMTNVPLFSPFEPFTVARRRIFVFTGGGDAMDAHTSIFDARTGKFLGKANSHGPLAILQGRAFFQDNWFLADYPDETYLNVHSLQTGRRLEAHTAAFGPTRVLDDRLIIQADDELRAFDLPPALKKTSQ